MLRLSKRVDYGLLVLGHMARGFEGEWYRVEDLASRYRIPVEQLSKVMQSMSRVGILTPRVGRHGGYSLPRGLRDIMLVDVIRAIEGDPALASCLIDDSTDCDQYDDCTLKRPLSGVQDRLLAVLQEVTVAEATGVQWHAPETAE